MKYFRKVIAEKDEYIEGGFYSWLFYKKIKDFKKGYNYQPSGTSLSIEDVISWNY